MNEIILDKSKFKNGIYFLSETDSSFESIYIAIRENEKRVYSDKEVRLLPNTSSKNPHKEEWKMRKRLLQRFTNYMQKYSNKLNVLEIGSGNGWFSANIAKRSKVDIYALDINKFELEQAARVFNFKNIYFVYGNIFDNIFTKHSFDIITLNSSIQYFDDLNKLVKRLFYFLSDEGEIHILDSPIYKQDELASAKERTVRYYISIDFPDMTEYYYHHAFDELNEFNYKILYDPKSVQNNIKKILGFKESPFLWIKIVKR
ncbi:MAG: class I SAM-dependent methyltransferase [Ignavibacteria bacterium]|nr:MAG: class I SAM-dependent methyltransferase [Ignavibacteria bacterium]